MILQALLWAGCWAGSAQFEMLHSDAVTCPEVAFELSLDHETSQIHLKRRAWDCPDGQELLWTEQNFDVKGRQIWGGRNPQYIGWWDEESVYIEDPVSTGLWSERNIAWDEEEAYLLWSEEFMSSATSFWTFEAKLEAVSCDDVQPEKKW